MKAVKQVVIIIIIMFLVSNAFAGDSKWEQGEMTTPQKVGTGVGAGIGFGSGATAFVTSVITIGGSLSGPAIMTTLATAGTIVGAGAAAGVIVVAGGILVTTAAGAYGGYKLIEWYETED
jgi:hypothetical protein